MVVPGRQPQGGGCRAYRDVFTACPAPPYPVWALFAGGASIYVGAYLPVLIRVQVRTLVRCTLLGTTWMVTSRCLVSSEG